MAIADYTMREIERKAKSGIAMDTPNEAKIQAYNKFNPTNTFYGSGAQQQQKPQNPIDGWGGIGSGQPYKPPQAPDDFSLNTKDGSAWFVGGNGNGQRIESNNIFGTLGNMQQSYNNAFNSGRQSLADKYKSEYDSFRNQLVGQGFDASKYGDDFTKYSQGFGNDNWGLSGSWDKAYEDGQYGDSYELMQRNLGIGNNVDLRFDDWDNYDAVMDQLSSASTAIGVLNKDESVRKEDVEDIYNHYLRAHKRASELGYGGVVSPGFQTGHTGNSDYVSAFDRGFGGGAIQDQWANLAQDGTVEGANQARLQRALDSLVKLDAVQSELGVLHGGNYNLNDILGSNTADNELRRHVEFLQEMGIVDEGYNAQWDGANHAINRLMDRIEGGDLKYNDYSSSSVNHGSFQSTLEKFLQNSDGYERNPEHQYSNQLPADWHLDESTSGNSSSPAPKPKPTAKVNEQQKALAEAIQRYLLETGGALA